MSYAVKEQREDKPSYSDLGRKEKRLLVKKGIRFVTGNLEHILNGEPSDLINGIDFELSNKFEIDYVPRGIKRFILRKSAERLTRSIWGSFIYELNCALKLYEFLGDKERVGLVTREVRIQKEILQYTPDLEYDPSNGLD